MDKRLHKKEKELEVLALYSEGVEIKEICRITGVGHGYPTAVAVRNNITRGSGKKSGIPLSLFQLGAPATNYWIGYLISDGNVMCSAEKRQYNIRFSTIDKEIIEKFLRYNPLCHIFQQTPTLTTLHFGSRLIAEYLVSLGITPNKSKTIKLNFEMDNHILRGIFDGDGSVHNKKACIKITTGSEALGTQIVDYLKTQGVYSKLRLRLRTTTYDVWVERTSDYKRFYELLYKDANPEIYMERKFNKFKPYWETTSPLKFK